MADAAHEPVRVDAGRVDQHDRFTIAGSGKQSGAGSPAHFRPGSPSPLSRSITSARVSSMKLKSPIAVAPSASANLNACPGPCARWPDQRPAPAGTCPRACRPRPTVAFPASPTEGPSRAAVPCPSYPPERCAVAVLARLGEDALNAGGIRAFHHAPRPSRSDRRPARAPSGRGADDVRAEFLADPDLAVHKLDAFGVEIGPVR